MFSDPDGNARELAYRDQNGVRHYLDETSEGNGIFGVQITSRKDIRVANAGGVMGFVEYESGIETSYVTKLGTGGAIMLSCNLADGNPANTSIGLNLSSKGLSQSVSLLSTGGYSFKTAWKNEYVNDYFSYTETDEYMMFKWGSIKSGGNILIDYYNKIKINKGSLAVLGVAVAYFPVADIAQILEALAAAGASQQLQGAW